ncbi:MAG: hypothetical protein IPM54_25360 [Polyangiaceae bacterium]|nr:hypothetical protein [Polyangiaceae bacterium]
MSDALPNAPMDDVICCLDKLNQSASLTATEAAILSRSTTAPVVKAAVLARLLHRPATNIETQLCAQLAAELPDVTATLRSAFPEHCSALSVPTVNPHPRVTRVLRADWTDGAARCADLRAFLDDYVHERLPSHLVAAWLGTVMERGMSMECLHDMTHAMKDSGRTYDYRGAAPLAGRKLVRRYPTGGLSEKAALILPSVLVKAATNIPIASNFLVARSLGFTGGTWDKLSAIPGFRFPEPGDESIEVMSRCGVAMTVTHGDLNPADRKLYQLRSVTGTIESHELIVASIASKQLAVPADHLLLDVRYGEGAFLRSEAEARRCADAMLSVVAEGGVPCSAHLTDTPQPNGMAIGNALEVAEALATMGIGASSDWDARALREQRELVLTFYGLLMLRAHGSATTDAWVIEARGWFESGEVGLAFETLLEAHGVRPQTIDALRQNPFGTLGLSGVHIPVASAREGQLLRIDQRRLGHLVNFGLGAGGNDYGGAFRARAGIRIGFRIGDHINEGQPLCWIFSVEPQVTDEFIVAVKECFIVG